MPSWNRREPRSSTDERKIVTICVAALFRWNHGTAKNPSYHTAAVALSDRKITNFDIEYEPNQLKIGVLSPRALVLIGGEITTHTEAIYTVLKQIKPDLCQRTSP